MTGIRRCRVFRLPTSGPADISGLPALLDSGALEAGDIRAILGKTEGNGCVNDFTRAFAVSTLQTALAGPLGCTPAQVGEQVAMVMSGGTEGGLSPHLLVFAAGPADGPPAKGLAIGPAFTRRFRPEELGRLTQIEATAAAVARAMQDAGIADAADVHYMQVKCPLLTSESGADAAARGRTVVTDSTTKSMGYSRGASALGAGAGRGGARRHRR